MNTRNSGALAPCDARDPANATTGRGATPPFRPAPEEIAKSLQNRADVMVDVAVHLCASGAAYGHQGRGPFLFDDLGLVRACAQGAVDWEASRLGLERPAALDDFDDYAPNKVDTTDVGKLILSWGLVRLGMGRHLHVLKDAKPGDIIQYLGRGPAAGICIGPWIETERFPNFDSPAVAYVWPDQPPRVSRDSRMSWHPLALYRWPEVDQ